MRQSTAVPALALITTTAVLGTTALDYGSWRKQRAAEPPAERPEYCTTEYGWIGFPTADGRAFVAEAVVEPPWRRSLMRASFYDGPGGRLLVKHDQLVVDAKGRVKAFVPVRSQREFDRMEVAFQCR